MTAYLAASILSSESFEIQAFFNSLLIAKRWIPEVKQNASDKTNEYRQSNCQRVLDYS